MSGLRIEKLSSAHRVEAFDCGREPLNRFIKRHALQSSQSNGAQTYVGVSDETIIGFHSLTIGEVSYSASPERLVKGLARHHVPVMILARLAVHADWQGKGVGSGLLKDAVLRTLNAADIAGIRALVVHAKDETARTFYRRYDFTGGFEDASMMYILIKDLQALV